MPTRRADVTSIEKPVPAPPAQHLGLVMPEFAHIWIAQERRHCATGHGRAYRSIKRRTAEQSRNHSPRTR